MPWHWSVRTSSGLSSAADATDAKAMADRVNADLAALEREVQRLSRITEALWRLLQEQHGYPEEKLRAMVAAIESADTAAAKAGRLAPPCAKCGRPLSKSHPRCLYCGAEHPTDLFGK